MAPAQCPTDFSTLDVTIIAVGKREQAYLPEIQRHIENQLGRSLRRVDEQSEEGPSHDLETSDEELPKIALEAKEIVSSNFLATRSQVASTPSYRSNVLRKHWMLAMDDPRLGEWYDPSSQEFNKEGGLAGLSILKLFRDVEPLLKVLDDFGIERSRSTQMGSASSPDEMMKVRAARIILSQTVNGVFLATTANDDHPPGIDVAFSYSYVRKGSPEPLLERVKAWLNSSSSANLLASLVSADADERHAALWVATDPEASSPDMSTTFKPTSDIDLPERVDVLWVFLPPIVWRYGGEWSVSSIN
jgi:hypothetical protein